MTGFGRAESSDGNYQLTVEIKSVNHRFKDVRFKMSNFLNREEVSLKRVLEQVIGRGSIDVSVQYKSISDENKFDDLDPEKIARFVKSMKVFMDDLKVQLEVRPCEFLRAEFQKDKENEKFQSLQSLLKKSFKEALDILVSNRQEEGSKLKDKIVEHIGLYKAEHAAISTKAEGYKKAVEEKLKTKLQEHQGESSVDESRFLQEVIYYLEKLDISEELLRIEVHLEKILKTMSESGPIGRQLDFLVQELNRETNTIGSKSNSSEISNAVVNMKVHLEKIREQALNIE